MKLSKSTWFYIIAAFVTLFGIVTRMFILIALAFPIGLFGLTSHENDNE
jgi:hypothetical protein